MGYGVSRNLRVVPICHVTAIQNLVALASLRSGIVEAPSGADVIGDITTLALDASQRPPKGDR
jgi:hypothetical protein